LQSLIFTAFSYAQPLDTGIPYVVFLEERTWAWQDASGCITKTGGSLLLSVGA